MKNQITIFWFLIFILLAGCTQNGNDSVENSTVVPANLWKRFLSSEGKFSILLPGVPEERTQTMHSSKGEMEGHVFNVKANIQDLYGLTYADIPPNIDLGNLSDYFDRVQTMEAGEKGRIVFQQDLKLGDFPGREFEFVAGGKANYSGRIRIFLANRRLYVLPVIFLTAKPHPADRTIFFNSFTILADQ